MKLYPLGIDIGYSAVKACSAPGHVVEFPSVVGTPDTARFSMESGAADLISISGHEMLVGADAVLQSRMLQRREDRYWYSTREYTALYYKALTASSFEDQEMYVVSGLPVAFYDDRKQLHDMLLGHHTFTTQETTVHNYRVAKCTVIPQPFGTVLAQVLGWTGDIQNAQLAQGAVGVVDCGGKTTNLLHCVKMSEIARATGSVNAGAWDAVRAMRTLLEVKYPKLELRDHDIIQAMAQGFVKMYGDEVDILAMTTTVVNPLADQIIAQCTQLWGSGADLDTVLVTGGGALLFGSHIENAYQHAVIVDNPVQANAVGYYKLAVRKVVQHGTD
jgi:plasmid segregation protein ParM